MNNSLVSRRPSRRTLFRIRVRSRHPSHDILRTELSKLPFRSIVRLGSTTEVTGIHAECNSTAAIRVTSNKLKTKQAFLRDGVASPAFEDTRSIALAIAFVKMLRTVEHKAVVVKNYYGSRNQGNTKWDITTDEDVEKLTTHIQRNAGRVYVEAYMPHKKYNEFRVHVNSANDNYYICRKALKSGTPEEQRWFRNDSNCVWLIEENLNFGLSREHTAKVVSLAKAALNATKLDIGACDILVSRESPDEMYVLEINSAPSFGQRTAAYYLQNIPEVLINNYN